MKVKAACAEKGGGRGAEGDGNEKGVRVRR